MKIRKLVFITLFVLCTSCNPATPSKEDLDNELEKKIASEYELWKKLSMDSYQIELDQHSVWVNYNLSIIVKANQVIDFEANCGDALLDFDSSFCAEVISKLSPNTYTIQALFDQLQKSHRYFKEDSGEYVTSTWSESISITFDSQYHYPKSIRYDIPEAHDEQYTLEILSFRVLQE